MVGLGRSGLPSTHIERAKYLWEEFKYRHDLIWQLLFRVTTVAALLSLVPFVVDDAVTKKVGPLVMVGPGLAVILLCASLFLLHSEFVHFDRADALHIAAQKVAVRGLQVPTAKHRRSRFKATVYAYVVILILLAWAVLWVAWARLDKLI